MKLVQPSQLVGDLCDSLKKHEETGLQLKPEDIRAVHRNLRMIQELASEIEEENRILEARLAAVDQRRQSRAAAAVLPFRPRLRIAPLPDNGGDAA